MSSVTQSDIKGGASTLGNASSAANPLGFSAVRRPRSSSPASEAGDTPVRGYGAAGMYREVPTGTQLLGRGPAKPDPRKFGYDVQAGKSNPLKFVVTRDDRMSAAEAGEKLNRIHKVMGVASAEPEILYAFDRGLWFCHTVNGASTLNPGRSTWTVPGHTTVFDYKTVVDTLGVDLRRFFREFADEIQAANQAVLDSYDPSDLDSVEHRGWLMEVAAERGLTRYPQLAHDSSDACTQLGMAERQAVMNSKRMVLSATINSADRARNTSRVQSQDKYDSTTGDSFAKA